MATQAEHWAFREYIGQLLQRMNPDHGSTQDDVSSIAYTDFDEEVKVVGKKAFISHPDDKKPSLYLERDADGVVEMVVAWEDQVMAREGFVDQIREKGDRYLK
jgi:hypothetical protein